MKTLLPIFFPLFIFIAFVDLSEAQKMDARGVRDIENHVYDTLTIGTQVWMTTNLKVKRYNNGTPIPLVGSNTEWANLSTPGYTDITMVKGAGRNLFILYNYYTISDANSLKVCPVGWHVPTDAEWMTLSDTLEGISLAGGEMKDKVLDLWLNQEYTKAGDEGYEGSPGVYRDDNGSWQYVKDYPYGIWWSSTEGSSSATISQYFTCMKGEFEQHSGSKRFGLPIRCLKD